MKKFVLVMIAAVMALGMSAFTTSQEKTEGSGYFWYDPVSYELIDPNQTVGTAHPMPQCTQTGVGCAIGFTQPTEFPGEEEPDATRQFNVQ